MKLMILQNWSVLIEIGFSSAYAATFNRLLPADYFLFVCVIELIS